MYYITKKASPHYHQMSVDELLFCEECKPSLVRSNRTNTVTKSFDNISEYYKALISVNGMINALRAFNEWAEPLRSVDRRSLYDSFKIPKKTGGLRQIDAPNDELKNALRVLQTTLESFAPVDVMLYHTSAFAYVKDRCTKDAVIRHQQNESRWFAKFDLHDFFGSTTLGFVIKMFSMVYPFSELLKDTDGRKEFEKAIELAFLDGGLPQGTPISPFITNVMMIPVDHCLANTLRDYDRFNFIYTRYADDFCVSCRYHFRYKKVEDLILKTLKDFEAPFSLNTKKTKYGSSSGSNWILGMVLNKENDITIGYKNKRRFESMLFNYAMDKKNGTPWSLEDVQYMDGLRSYYVSVEGEKMEKIIEFQSKKTGVDIVAEIKKDLHP